MEKAQKTGKPNKFQLTPQITSRLDLGKIIKEIEAIDDFLYQANLRQSGTTMSIPKTTKGLEDIAEINHFSLLDQGQRSLLIKYLRTLKKDAPLIHMSFAVEPPPGFMQKIILWLRDNIHPLLLVEVGLQPTISVGCVVRTNNKIFDMSLKHRFASSRKILVEEIGKSQ